MTAALPDWKPTLAVLAAIWAAILLLLRDDVAAMVMIWWDSSTFNHVLLMLPLIGWLVVQRAPLLRPLRPTPWWPGALALFASGCVWLVGEAAGVALFRQLGVVMMLQSAVAAMLGPQLVRGLAFPLAYALLIVPFGEELVPLLQTVTAKLSMLLLGVAGIPAHIDGIFITTPGGFFKVAEACSGVKFLVAMVSYSVFAAHLCFSSWRRRIVFVAGALVATVFANALRAFGTIIIAENFGIAYAEGFDHLVYGWVFFGLVMLLVMAAAWRWFDRPANDPAVCVAGLDTPVRWAGRTWAICVAAALAISAPLVWSHFVGARSGQIVANIMPPTPPGWTMGGDPDPVWRARYDGADQFVQRRFTNADGQMVDVAIAAFSSQSEGREVVGFGQGAVDPDSDWAWSSKGRVIAGATTSHLFHPGPVMRDAATWYVVGGNVETDARMVKLAGLRARLFGGDPRAVAITISSEIRHGGGDAVELWLNAAGGAREVADRALKTR